MRHQEIEKLIRQKIASGDFRAGVMLPGRRELARRFKTSTITISRAIQALETEGLIRSDDRRGTFISENPAVTNRSAQPLTEPGEILRIAVVATLFLPRQDMGYGHNPWTRQVVASLEQELADSEHQTLFINTVEPDGTLTPLTNAVNRAVAEKVDGVILLAFSNEGADVEKCEKILNEAGVSCVVVSSNEVTRSVPHVFPDGFDAGFQAGQHLIRQGCQSAVFIAPRRAWWMQHRYMGVVAAWQQAGLPEYTLRSVPSEPTIEWDITMTLKEDAQACALEVFKKVEPNFGIIGANDEVALDVIATGKTLGFQPGRDYLAVGFDDFPEARSVGLTSMRIPWDVVGEEAARLLRQALTKRGECSQSRVRWKLIPRSSSRDASRQAVGQDTLS